MVSVSQTGTRLRHQLQDDFDALDDALGLPPHQHNPVGGVGAAFLEQLDGCLRVLGHRNLRVSHLHHQK